MDLKYFQINLNNLDIQLINPNVDNLIFISNKDELVNKNLDVEKFIEDNLLDRSNVKFLYISKRDNFTKDNIIEIVDILKRQINTFDVELLVPYLSPPTFNVRDDGDVKSFILDFKVPQKQMLLKYYKESESLIYHITYSYLNSKKSKNIEIYQIGKDTPKPRNKDHSKINFDESLLLIPHKGSPKLLKRLLHHLNLIKQIPSSIRLCFDDYSYEKVEFSLFKNLKNKLRWVLNNPINCGPYLARHYSIISNNKKFIFFQDSDDISTSSRFERQIIELSKNNWDLIGSHELRVEQFVKKLILFRFPIDVNNAFKDKPAHPLFHPTSMITKKGYLKTKGFSTDLTFGYDQQFTFRANFNLKIGNVDDFLYIRFKRPGSLTTHSKTKIGTSQRSFLSWRWRIDMDLVQEGKLNLEDSSLSVQKHKFDYKMIDKGYF